MEMVDRIWYPINLSVFIRSVAAIFNRRSSHVMYRPREFRSDEPATTTPSDVKKCVTSMELPGRLFLPESWTNNRARLDRADVPAAYRPGHPTRITSFCNLAGNVEAGMSQARCGNPDAVPFYELGGYRWLGQDEFHVRLQKFSGDSSSPPHPANREKRLFD